MVPIARHGDCPSLSADASLGSRVANGPRFVSGATHAARTEGARYARRQLRLARLHVPSPLDRRPRRIDEGRPRLVRLRYQGDGLHRRPLPGQPEGRGDPGPQVIPAPDRYPRPRRPRHLIRAASLRRRPHGRVRRQGREVGALLHGRLQRNGRRGRGRPRDARARPRPRRRHSRHRAELHGALLPEGRPQLHAVSADAAGTGRDALAVRRERRRVLPNGRGAWPPLQQGRQLRQRHRHPRVGAARVLRRRSRDGGDRLLHRGHHRRRALHARAPQGCRREARRDPQGRPHRGRHARDGVAHGQPRRLAADLRCGGAAGRRGARRPHGRTGRSGGGVPLPEVVARAARGHRRRRRRV